MMQLMAHFRSKQDGYTDRMRRHEWFIKARHDREKREEQAEKLEDDNFTAAIEMLAATDRQIQAFRETLDRYDTATVTALMENRQQLDMVNAEIEMMLNQAYVIEDGRRVFKTENGEQVFDETGQEISREALDFELITPERPTWETFSAKKERMHTLLTEQQDIIEFQEKLDESRERLDQEGISEAELEALDAELMDIMPDAVRAQLPENTEPALKAEKAIESSASATPTTLPTADASAGLPLPGLK